MSGTKYGEAVTPAVHICRWKLLKNNNKLPLNPFVDFMVLIFGCDSFASTIVYWHLKVQEIL